MLTRFQRLESLLTRLALGLAMAGMAAMAGLAFYQVVTRFVLGAPSTWSEVAARSAMIWTVFLGAAYAFRSGAMIAVDVIFQIARGRLRLVLQTLAALLTLGLLLLLVWQGLLMTQRVGRQSLAGLDISIAWIYAALPVGAAFALFALLSRLIDVWRGTADEEAPP